MRIKEKSKKESLREIIGERVFLIGGEIKEPLEGTLVFGYREKNENNNLTNLKYGRLIVVPEENVTNFNGDYTCGYYFLSHEGSEKDLRVYRKDIYKITNPQNEIGDSLIVIRKTHNTGHPWRERIKWY